MRFRPTRTWWTLLFATVGALLVVNLAMRLPPLGPRLQALTGGAPILDMRVLGYGPVGAHAFLAALGPEGRRLYASLSWSVDLLMPALISTFLWTTASLGSLRRWRWAALPGGAADILENAAVTALLLTYPGEPATLVRAASALTVSKFALYLGGAALALAGATSGARHQPTRSKLPV
jgi:hypothetical protein